MKQTSRLGKEAGDAHPGAWSAVLRRLGATRLGVWIIKHVISPLDRRFYQRTGGQRVALGKPLGPLLLLTTTGRHTGKEHTNPGFEHPNPWTLNLRANPLARVQIGSERSTYQAREASEAEVERYWPQLVQVWPAYERFYQRSGPRVIFLLEPLPSSGAVTV